MNYPVAMPTLLKFEPKLLDKVQILPFTATKVFPVFVYPIKVFMNTLLYGRRRISDLE